MLKERIEGASQGENKKETDVRGNPAQNWETAGNVEGGGKALKRKDCEH
jgi:hypothetical protein